LFLGGALSDLEVIGIVMDVTVPVVLLPESLRSPDSKIRHLDVGDSRISDPLWVAAFISGVFSNLDFVECSYHGLTTAREEAREFESRWSTVQELIPVFRAVRVQERNRLLKMEVDGEE
jgi:hypothetical protein